MNEWTKSISRWHIINNVWYAFGWTLLSCRYRIRPASAGAESASAIPFCLFRSHFPWELIPWSVFSIYRVYTSSIGATHVDQKGRWTINGQTEGIVVKKSIVTWRASRRKANREGAKKNAKEIPYGKTLILSHQVKRK